MRKRQKQPYFSHAGIEFLNATICTETMWRPGLKKPLNYSFHLILDGEYRCNSEEFGNHVLHPGDLLANYVGREFTLSGPHYKYMMLDFNGPQSENFLAACGFSPKTRVLKNCPPHARTLMHEIMKTLPARHTDNPFFFYARLFQLGEEFWNVMLKSSGKRKQDYPKVIRQILEEHEYRLTNLNEMAALLNISPDTLRKACQRELGITAADYVTGLRMNRAKKLLKETSHKLSYIAHLCGYHDEKYFMTAFKKQTGMTASHWRNTIR
jgi:AraC-like DNA-binding protein